MTKSARRVSGHFKTFIKVKLSAEKVKGLRECLKSLRKKLQRSWWPVIMQWFCRWENSSTGPRASSRTLRDILKLPNSVASDSAQLMGNLEVNRRLDFSSRQHMTIVVLQWLLSSNRPTTKITTFQQRECFAIVCCFLSYFLSYFVLSLYINGVAM